MHEAAKSRMPGIMIDKLQSERKNFGGEAPLRTFLGLLLGLLAAACTAVSPPDTALEAVENEVRPRVAANSFGYTAEGFLFAGAPDAPVTVYEVFNANCPGCAQHHTQTLSSLVTQYGDTGQVRFVLVDLPLSREWGEAAHFTAFCIGRQQGAEAQWTFWQDFYSQLERWYRQGPVFTTELARRAGANLAILEDCLHSEAREPVFAMQTYAEANLLPARWSTPFFRLEDEKGRRLDTLTGSPPLAGWQKELARYLD